jgi:SHS2 domain-containing protein
MGRYSILEHTADKGLEVLASSLPDLFETAAQGLFALMIDLEDHPPSEKMALEVNAIDTEMLFVRWLNELLYHFEVHKRLFAKFKVELIEGNERKALRANVRYQVVDPQTIATIEWNGAPVKSVTYHDLVLESRDGTWYARFYVDV